MSVYVVERLGVAIGGTQVVHEVSFEIAAGECLALVGASGSGKTQSCLAPFGLAAGIASGSARLDGAELVGRSERDLRALRARSAGFVFQQPLTALTPHLTIGRQLAEAWTQSGAARPGRRDLAAALDRVGLTRPDERLDQYPHRLSGGERQRVMIAAAVAHAPRLLVADEPTTALDATLKGEILSLLDRLRAEQGLAVLLVSHDLVAAAAHADRVAVLSAGRVVDCGPAAQLLAHPTVAETRALVAATPRLSEPAPDLPPTGDVLLDATDVRVRFTRPGWRRGTVEAVAGIDLQVHRGEGVAIVGGSGSGKSTLGRAVSRLGPMQAGTLALGGPRARPAPPHARRRARPDPAGVPGPGRQPRSALARRRHCRRAAPPPPPRALARRAIDSRRRALEEVELPPELATGARPSCRAAGAAGRDRARAGVRPADAAARRGDLRARRAGGGRVLALLAPPAAQPRAGAAADHP
jgi:peptide/nickel transport system ATP-binding protein